MTSPGAQARACASVAIDPGVKHLGFAIAWGGEVQAIGCSSRGGPYGSGADRLARLAEAHAHTIRPRLDASDPIVYLESMVATRDRATTAQDLIDVQTVGCLTAGALRPTRVVLCAPGDWKASVPKHVHHPRLIQALTGYEARIVSDGLQATPDSHHKEALDALGILLYALGRVKRSGVPWGT